MRHRLAAAIARQSAPIRIVVFLGLLLLIWLPFAAPIQWLAWRLNSDQIPLIALGILYVEFLLLLRVWRQELYHEPHPLYRCGFKVSRRFMRLALQGFAMGCLGVAVLFGVEVLLGWATLAAPGRSLLGLALEGLVTAIAVGFCEELFFRGWLLIELEQDYGPFGALVVSSGLFAIAHYIRPLAVILATWPQFLGLYLLGITLVWAKRASRSPRYVQQTKRIGESLGAPMGLHAGLVWSYYVVNVGSLIDYSPAVSLWIVGIDGNPLAGLLGIILLGAIAIYFRIIAEQGLKTAGLSDR
ncbi:MAG: type II CAAX endopeptidase family protein [Cyanobacteria bacterium J06635_15]